MPRGILRGTNRGYLQGGGPRHFDIREIPPLRRDPEDTADDRQRIEYVYGLWNAQDDALRLRDRQIEENVRMLAGQQYSIFHPRLGRWINVTDWMTKDERRWRQRPVFNRLLPWFIITHARMTENPPIITFLPGPDRIDAELAEVMDIIWKKKWRDVGMIDVWDRAASWLIPGGTVYLQTRIDLSKGDLTPYIGRAQVPIIDAEGNLQIDPVTGNPITQEFDQVPFDADGNPLARMTPDGLQTMGEAHVERRGDLVVDVLSPLQVRGQWGPQPWHQKRRHMVKSFVTPAEVYELWGILAEPTSVQSDSGELERLLFGRGYFGAASDYAGTEWSTTQTGEGYVEILTLWEAPSSAAEGMQETEESPGGRLLIVTPDRVLRDGPRPLRFKHTSPIRAFEFVRLPGRPGGGSTPQEAMNPVQQTYNRGWAQILEHRNLVTNPKAIIDDNSGLEASQWTNRPGEGIVLHRTPNVIPVEWIAPPPLGQDVYRSQQMLLDELLDMGSLRGTEGDPPSDEASGELIKELRFNSDRFLGPTMRRSVEEFARLADDFQVYMPVLYDAETLVSYAGDDNMARTITVMPHLFEEGHVNVTPDMESMLPEGRGERAARIYKMWMDGAFGDPFGEGRKRLHELLRFPHMGRAANPGGIDSITADQENGRLLQGEDAATIPTFEWYDDIVHLDRHEQFMKSPEFLKLDPQIQTGFIEHRENHLLALQQKLMTQMGAMGAAGPPAAGGGGGGGSSGVAEEMQQGSGILPPPASQRMPRGGVPSCRFPTEAGQSVPAGVR